MASGDILAFFAPLNAEFPSTGYPALAYSFDTMGLAFYPDADDTCYFLGIMPKHLSSSYTGIKVTLSVASGAAGNVKIGISFDKKEDGSSYISASFDTAVTTTYNYTDVPNLKDISIDIPVENMDGVQAGDIFKMKLYRSIAGVSSPLSLPLGVMSIKLEEL